MEIKEITHSRSVFCDGTFVENNIKSLGHPKVFLQIKDGESTIVCPYCSKQFILEHKDNMILDTH